MNSYRNELHYNIVLALTFSSSNTFYKCNERGKETNRNENRFFLLSRSPYFWHTMNVVKK